MTKIKQNLYNFDVAGFVLSLSIRIYRNCQGSGQEIEQTQKEAYK